MTTSITEFAVGALAVWRITHLFHAEDGPWDLLARFRRWVGNEMLGKMLDCFYCLSVWMALPIALALGASWHERLLLWPALSGAAILLERATERSVPAVPTAEWYEEADGGES